ncbi:VaFE repeat-containing surface-anchored protein [Candidatus Saccharibacteria bacterium]|nr:VaFE repeat-containing surface-anchored protein [Candidatus Saccharibacteria bacterium]
MVFGLARKVQIRKALVFAFCVAIFAGLTLSIVKIVKEGANAAEGNVSVVYDSQKVIPYGTGGSSTYIFSIDSNTGRHLGFCGDPGDRPPSGGTAVPVSASDDRTKRILLATYAYIDHGGLIRRMLPSVSADDVNTQYGWLHSVVAYFHTNGTNDGINNDADRAILNNAIAVINNEIATNGQAWVDAQKYNLYSVGGEPGFQTMYWIEPKPLGSIKITKKDATTNSATPQGNASFNGIKFTAKNKNGQIEKSCTLSNNSNSCTISDLEYGEYTVSESAGNNTYQVNVNTTETVTVDGGTEDVEFKNEVKKGNITVRKKDAKMQNGECKTTSGHSFNGITFGLYLDKTTSNKIKHGNKEYDPKSEQNEILIAKKTIGEDGCEVKFNNLPIAKYYIKEISANNDYIISSEVERVNLTADKSGSTIEVEFSNQPTSIGTVAVDGKDGDQYVEVSPESNIKDTIQYCVEPNKNYTIKGVLMDKSTGKELLVNGKKVEGSVDLKPTTSCGEVVMEFELDTSALGGKEVVVFERLYEHKDDGNYDDEEPIVEHKDINDPKQTIDIISLETVAEDGTDGDKEILADQAAVVKDTVSYCVKPGQKYTIRGILMDKSTGEPLLVNGEKVEGAVEIEPTEACGTAEMLFHFDATGLQGKELVVFEKLYIFGEDNPDEDEPIITHEDINDENQAVIVYMPTPNTGRFTAKDGGGRIGEFILAPAAIVVVVGGYGIYRASARKRFLRRK